MMILGNFKHWALGAMLVTLATPAVAGASVATAESQPMASADGQRGQTNARRVELPFPLRFRAPDKEPEARAPHEAEGPHPFRETPSKRAVLDYVGPARAANGGGLSQHPEFG